MGEPTLTSFFCTISLFLDISFGVDGFSQNWIKDVIDLKSRAKSRGVTNVKLPMRFNAREKSLVVYLSVLNALSKGSICKLEFNTNFVASLPIKVGIKQLVFKTVATSFNKRGSGHRI